MIVQSDLLIKTAITHVIEEARKNPWLIDDILSELTCDPLLKDIYGEKEIARAKEWLANNQINVALRYVNDEMQTPCVTITLGGSSESNEHATLGDADTEVVTLSPKEINRPIPYIIKPFVAAGYDQDTGTVIVPEGVETITVSEGMFVVNPDTGNAYEISKKDGCNLVLKNAPVIDFTSMGVIPQYREWRARVEQAKFKETYSIGCHVSGDPAPLLWLHSILLYGMLRYRESLFEARGLMISSVSSTDLVDRNSHFQNPAGEQVFSRWITLSGIVKNSWIKSPKRVIESLILGEKTDNGFISGVKIIMTEDAPKKAPKTGVWATEPKVDKKKKAIFRA